MSNSRQIPKIIHYCWFGGKEKPELVLKCIASWKKFLPDYEIKEWNEYNFDVNIVPYTQEAYNTKKYAFVSDYARFWILFNYGGIYFDTDVEVVKSFDKIIENGAFMGREKSPSIYNCNPGLGIGCAPGLGIYKKLLDKYASLHFKNDDGSLNLKTIVEYTTELLLNKGLTNANKLQQVEGINIYPKEYFCPKFLGNGKYKITKNTYSIHHYATSWVDNVRNFGKIKLPLGVRLKFYICKENTKEINILPNDEIQLLKFYKSKRRYIVITIRK